MADLHQFQFLQEVYYSVFRKGILDRCCWWKHQSRHWLGRCPNPREWAGNTAWSNRDSNVFWGAWDHLRIQTRNLDEFGFILVGGRDDLKSVSHINLTRIWVG